MRIRRKNIVNEEPIDIIIDYFFEIDEIKNKMIKNNIVRYDSFEEEYKYDDDMIKWMCSFTAKDFI